MTYLFSSNVEVSNDIGNALPISVTNTDGNIVSLSNPFPVTLGSNSIQIVGNISIPTTVNVASSHDNPVHTHVDELGNIDLSNTWMPIEGNVTVTGNVGITGNVNVNPITVTSITSNVNVNPISVTGITSNVNVNPISVTSITSNVNVNPISGNVHVYGNVGIDGNVNVNPLSATVSGNIGILNTNGNIVSNTNPFPVTGNVTVTQAAGTTNLVKYINTPDNLQMDMTQRLRVSTLAQSWWYAPTVDKDGDLRYIESNVGVNSGSIWVQNLASINMSSGTAANGSFIRISRRRHKMRPGVSMSAAFGINWNGYVPDGNVTKRVGVFTNFNGIFYEMTGDLQVVIRRRLTDGTLDERRVLRENFNLDSLNGLGPTGYDLRPTVSNTSTITAHVSTTAVPITGDGTVYRVVFTVGTPSQFSVGMKGRITGVSPITFNGTVMVTAISGSNVTFVYTVDPGVFSSLSSAKFEHTSLHCQYTFGFDFNGNRNTSVRFFIDGPLGRVAIHQENFGGELSTPFSNAPSMSTRYEIVNSGAPGRIPNFTCGSEVLNIEAELELNPGFGLARNNTYVEYAKGGTAEYALLGLGLRAGEPYQRGDLQLQSLQIIDIANINPQNSGVFYWRLLLNPTITGGNPTASNIGKASRQWAYTTSTTWTGGIELMGGYTTQSSHIDVRTALNFLNLGSNIAYDDADKLVLVVKQLVGGVADARIVGSVNFIEAL